MLEFKYMIFAFDKSESVKFWLTEFIELKKIVSSRSVIKLELSWEESTQLNSEFKLRLSWFFSIQAQLKIKLSCLNSIFVTKYSILCTKNSILFLFFSNFFFAINFAINLIENLIERLMRNMIENIVRNMMKIWWEIW